MKNRLGTTPKSSLSMRVCIAFLLGVSLLAVRSAPGQATALSAPRVSVSSLPATGPAGLALSASPSQVDVGMAETFVLSAKAWPGPVSVKLSFVSPHHGFSGSMTWEGQCSCFELAVALARRVHSLEQARAVATVLYRGSTSTAMTTFQIRGLAPNGKDYAPGGQAYLSGWVADSSPVPGEYQHYCAWVKTADGLGVTGYPVSFVVHFPHGTQKWKAGRTGKTGLVCSHRAIGSPLPGSKVAVDIYAGNLHTTTSFTPRAS